jgi:hypothetical protein
MRAIMMKLENEYHGRNTHSDNAIDPVMVQEVWRVIMTAMKATAQTHRKTKWVASNYSQEATNETSG